MYMYKRLLGITGAVLLTTSMNLCAAEDITDAVTKSGKKTEAQAGISAKELVKKSYNYLASLNNYAFKATIVNEDDYAGKMLMYIKHDYDVAVQRPNKVRMQVRGYVENRNTVMNNGKVTVHDLEANTYAQIPVENNIDDALDTLMDDYNLSIPLTQLLYSDSALELEEELETDGYYFGTVLVDTLPCYYIGFAEEEWDVQLWIEKGNRPVIRRVAFRDKTMKGHPRSMIKVAWNVDNMEDESLFNLTVPKGVKKIEMKKIATDKTVKKDQK